MSLKQLIFSSRKKQLDHELKVMLSGKKLYPTDSVKYLGTHLDKYLTWKQIDNVANAMLSKLKHNIDIKTLKSIYRSIFDSHLS